MTERDVTERVPQTHRVSVRRRPPEGWISLQAEPGAHARIADAAGVRLPGMSGRVARDAAMDAFCVGPQAWLLRCELPDEDACLARLREATAGLHAALALVSDASVGFDVTGEDATAVLAQGCPLDLDAMTGEDCVRTLLGRVPVLVARVEGGFALWVERSHARHVQAWLEAAAAASR